MSNGSMCFMIFSRRTGDVYCRCTCRNRKRGLHWRARVSTTTVLMSPLEQPYLNIHHLWITSPCLFGRNAARCGAAACRNMSPASPRSQQHGREMSETLQQVMFLSGWRPVCGSRVRQFCIRAVHVPLLEFVVPGIYSRPLSVARPRSQTASVVLERS